MITIKSTITITQQDIRKMLAPTKLSDEEVETKIQEAISIISTHNMTKEQFQRLVTEYKKTNKTVTQLMEVQRKIEDFVKN